MKKIIFILLLAFPAIITAQNYQLTNTYHHIGEKSYPIFKAVKYGKARYYYRKCNPIDISKCKFIRISKRKMQW